MTVEIISWLISMKVWDGAGIKLVTPDQQSDSLPTVLRGPVFITFNLHIVDLQLFQLIKSQYSQWIRKYTKVEPGPF